MPNMLQTDHNGLLPRADAVDNVNMTYHHVISRSILCRWWNAMEARGHVGAARDFIEALIDTTYARLGFGQATPKVIPACLTNNDGRYVIPSMLKSAIARFDNGTWSQSTDGANWDVFVGLFQWWPGNIHRGPTSRVMPGFPGWEAEVDDGGDHFEVSARWVIPESTFLSLEAGCTAIEAYIAATNDSSSKQVQVLNHATSQLMGVARLEQFHPYDKRRWYQLPDGTNQGRWRIKRP